MPSLATWKEDASGSSISMSSMAEVLVLFFVWWLGLFLLVLLAWIAPGFFARHLPWANKIGLLLL